MERKHAGDYTGVVVDTILPRGAVERFVFWGILAEFAIYFAGLGPLRIPLTVWPVVLMSGLVWLRRGERVPWLTALWFACMSAIFVQQVLMLRWYGVGGWSLPNWFLCFGVAALVPLAGLYVRPEVIYSAAGLLGIQTLAYCTVATVAVLAGFDPHYQSFVPRVDVLEGAYFGVGLTQARVFSEGELRLVAFSPYPTSAGAIACFFALMTLGNKNPWVKWLGLAGWIALEILAKARTGALCMAVAIPMFYLLSFRRRHYFLVAGVAILALAAFAGPAMRGADRAQDALRELRASSSMDRTNLRRIALDGWLYGERPVLGSGTSVPGGAVVSREPIGTHDSLAAGLYLRGALGLCLTLLPIVVSLVFGCFGGRTPAHRMVAAGAVVLLLYTNSQTLAEVFMFIWPFFVLIGALGRESTTTGTQPSPAPCTPSATL